MQRFLKSEPGRKLQSCEFPVMCTVKSLAADLCSRLSGPTGSDKGLGRREKEGATEIERASERERERERERVNLSKCTYV